MFKHWYIQTFDITKGVKSCIGFGQIVGDWLMAISISSGNQDVKKIIEP